ncbi:hypothetical protein HZB02_04090 [Candidatus Woesearchaeota archaeon]|nr:hypothetical protein [Candidatus Woesearchaeota archaeon]
MNSSRGKRGDVTAEQLFLMFEVLLAIIIFLSLMNFVVSLKDNTLFEKNYLARDLALLTDTVYAAPEQLSYTYTENVDRFGMNIKDGKVSIFDEPEWKTDQGRTATFFLYGKDADQQLEPFNRNPFTTSSPEKKNLLYQKQGTTVAISEVKNP